MRASCAVVLAVLGIACDAERIGEPCGQIPAGGCPRARGGSCQDPACAAIYDCVDGGWRAAESCPPQQGAGGAAGAGGGAVAGGCEPARIDKSGQVQGCAPELQDPDCPAVAAEICEPCISGCSDFFLCLRAGWTLVGYCTEEGTFVVVPKE